MRHTGSMLAVVALGIVMGACSQGPKLSLRHHESGLNSAFRYSEMSYPEYEAHMRRVITQARTDLTPENQTKIVAWNSPFILKPDAARCPAKQGRYRDGILLIHGLTDSPFHMWDLAAHFQEKCFVVYGLLLPGHGTVPGDLLSVTYEDWIKAAQFGITRLKEGVSRVYVGGFSTGGTLAVHAALNDSSLAGLLLFAPAIGLKSKAVRFAGTVDTFSTAQGSWVDVAPDEDPAKYESFPLNAADQIWKLTEEVDRERRGALTLPIFVALSADDQTVDSSATIALFRETKNPRSRMIVYSRDPAPSDDDRIQSVLSEFPAENIVAMAHLSLTNAPANPHYGRNGDYRNCLYYLTDPKSWDVCKRDAVPLGELVPELLKKRVLRRLTYNPDFPRLIAEIDAFLGRLQ